MQGFKCLPFTKFVYCASGGTGTGASAADPLPIQDQDLMTIDAGMVITEVLVVVTTALTGTTQMDIGDDDDQNGFVAAATLTAVASQGQGAYLNSSGANLAKYYAAAGKEVKMDNATTNTAGAMVVIIKGYKVA